MLPLLFDLLDFYFLDSFFLLTWLLGVSTSLFMNQQWDLLGSQGLKCYETAVYGNTEEPGNLRLEIGGG